MSSRVLTIMFTDIKGFTEKTSAGSREELRQLLELHEKLLLPVVAKFGGHVVKTIGDALLVTFESPTNALLCALMMQNTLYVENTEKSAEERLHIRVAISSGEVEMRGDDVFGEAVNVAARIEGITEAGEIFFTESVYLAMNKAEVPSSEVGLHRLKGIPEQIKIFKVIQDRNSDSYKKLINRLRDNKFADIAIPDTGLEKSCVKLSVNTGHGFRRAGLFLIALLVLGSLYLVLRPDPMIQKGKSIEEALKIKDFGLAFKRAEAMINEFPENSQSHGWFKKVVGGEIDDLIEKERFGDALELLGKRSNLYPWFHIDPYEKKILLSQGKFYYDKDAWRTYNSLYDEILAKYPKDPDVLKAVLALFGADGRSSYLGGIAAEKLAEIENGPLDDLVARTLLNKLFQQTPESEYSIKQQKMIAERYPAYESYCRERLLADKDLVRINAFTMLKEKGRLEEPDIFNYHIKNLVCLKSSYTKFGEESIDYFSAECVKPDWAEIKKKNGLLEFKDIGAYYSWSDYQKKVSDILRRAFFPESKEMLKKWVVSLDSFYRRLSAYKIIKDAGASGEIDEWKFHEENITDFNGRTDADYFNDALEFFKSQSVSERKEDALKVLNKLLTTLREHNVTYQKNKSREWEEVSLNCIEKTQKAMSGF